MSHPNHPTHQEHDNRSNERVEKEKSLTRVYSDLCNIANYKEVSPTFRSQLQLLNDDKLEEVWQRVKTVHEFFILENDRNFQRQCLETLKKSIPLLVEREQLRIPLSAKDTALIELKTVSGEQGTIWDRIARVYHDWRNK